MKLLFKQRFFSFFNSYDIYNEAGDTVFTVEGQLSLEPCFNIICNGREVGTVKRILFTLLPKFEIYYKDEYIGCISREFTLVGSKYNLDYLGWKVDGDFFGWDFCIYDSNGKVIASVTKELFNFTDTYVIDINDSVDTASVLILVIAIDSDKR